MELETLGQRLKAFRKTLKMSQKDMAEFLGIEQALISMVENNKTEFAYWHIKKLRDEYKLNTEWLELGKGEMFTEVPGNMELREPEELYTPRLTQRRVDRVMEVVGAIMREHSIANLEEFCLRNNLYYNYLYEFQGNRIKDPNKLIYDVLYRKYRVNLAYIFYEDQEMFRPKAGELQVLTIAVDRENNEVVKAVPVYAYAGYQRGFADPEFVDTLPDYDFYAEGDGTYRVFELKGDSMFPYLHEGDFLKSKFLPPLHWKDKLRLFEIFVIVGKDGIVCKQVTAHNVDTGDITLHSFNSLYDDYTVNLADVYELWYYKGFYSRRNLREVR